MHKRVLINRNVDYRMFKAISFGLLTTLLVLPVFGFAISLFLPPEFVGVGARGWEQQHNQLISVNVVKWLTVLGWVVAACLGGLVSTRISPTKTLRAAIWVGTVILLTWGIPVGIISGNNITWVHVTSALLIMPAVLLGGVLAQGLGGRRA